MMATIGETLRGYREWRDLSQREAATEAGMSQATWCQYERDEKLPRVRHGLSLAKLTKDSPYRVRLRDIAAAERAREAAREVERRRAAAH